MIDLGTWRCISDLTTIWLKREEQNLDKLLAFPYNISDLSTFVKIGSGFMVGRKKTAAFYSLSCPQGDDGL
jgi:hypothetical protein